MSKLTPKTTPKTEVKYDLNIPSLTLGFFTDRVDQALTGEDLGRMLFKEQYDFMTEAELVYCTCKALEPLTMVLPVNITCECGTLNTVAVELPKVMETTGKSLQEFTIDFTLNSQRYVFKFSRPKRFPLPDVKNTFIRTSLFVKSWCVGTNMTSVIPDFDFEKLPIDVYIKLLKLFSENVLGTTFKVETKCSSCGKIFGEEITADMDALAEFVNSI